MRPQVTERNLHGRINPERAKRFEGSRLLHFVRNDVAVRNLFDRINPERSRGRRTPSAAKGQKSKKSRRFQKGICGFSIYPRRNLRGQIDLTA